MFQHFQCIHVLGSMKLTTFYHAYISYAMPSSGILQISYESLVFSLYDQENTSEKWNIPWYTTREHCITMLYQNHRKYTGQNTHGASMEKDRCNTVEYTWLSCILIGCFLYGLV